MSRLTEYHCGVAVIKSKELLKEAMKKLAKYEDLEDIKEEQEKDISLKVMVNANGEAELYDDTWDITIHCTSQEEHKRCVELLNLAGKYKNLAEQGRLVELPCKVGDKAYHIIVDRMAEPSIYISVHEIKNVSAKAVYFADDWWTFEELLECNVFLNKEEAEKALEEMRTKT